MKPPIFLQTLERRSFCKNLNEVQNLLQKVFKFSLTKKSQISYSRSKFLLRHEKYVKFGVVMMDHKTFSVDQFWAF